MFWYPFWPGAYERAFGTAAPPAVRHVPDVAVRPLRWGPEPPDAVDLWLLQTVYERIATIDRCARCDAALGRDLRVVAAPTQDAAPRWHVSVTTRCRGRRRHAHTATVIRPAGDILLGSFGPDRR